MLTKDRVLGSILIVLAFLLTPNALAVFLTVDGVISTTSSRYAIYLTNVACGALGLALLVGWKLPSKLHSLLSLSLLLPLTGGIYAHTLAPVNPKMAAAREAKETALVFQREHDLDLLSQALTRGESVKTWFASEVEVTSLASLPELLDVGFGVKKGVWKIGHAAILQSDKLKLLKPLFDLAGEPSNLDFEILGGGFKDESDRDIHQRIILRGRAKQGWSWRGRAELNWQLNDQNQWQIRTWKMSPLELTKGARPLFSEATFEGELAKLLRTSVYEERIKDQLSGKGTEGDIQMFLGVKRRPSVAVVDVDGDSDDDIFLVRRAGNALLLHNRGDGTFEEAAADFGLDLSAPHYTSLFLDWDNDGDADLFVAQDRGVTFLENRAGSFMEKQSFPEFGEVGAMAAGDVDKDGLVDLVLATFQPQMNRGEIQTRRNKKPTIPSVTLLLNKGGLFEMGPALPTTTRVSMATSMGDLDQDGSPDIFVTSQMGADHILFNQAGGFSESIVIGQSEALHGRGASFADIDNDGWLDAYVCRPKGNSSLYRNVRGRLEVMGDSDPNQEAWPTGAQFADLNSDGWPDLYVPTGFFTAPAVKSGPRALRSRSPRQPNRVFLNDKGKLLEVSGSIGLESLADSRAFARLDFNNDGGVDIALVNDNAPFFQLFENQEPPKKSIALRLVGGNQTDKFSDWSNRDGLGARVKVEAGGLTQTRERHAGEGYGAQNSAQMLFALPPESDDVKVTIHWPSGRLQELSARAGARLLVRERES